MRIKELKRTVNVSWSPGEQHPVLLAAGSAAQQVDSSFSSNSQLELYGLNLEDPGLDFELKASLQTQHKFQKIVWSGAGVIVGGCDGGLLEFYSVDKLLKHTPEALIGSCTKHNGPISALDINPYQKNLLASGASDSEIFIWDINNTSQPMAPGNKSQPLEHVQGLAWNQQVQHILGSTFATRCVVWDLRKNEPIMKLSDSQSRTRWRALAWHPSVATQLCIASEDDQGPVVQLWDLRLAASPLATLEGHHKGVLSVSWCKQDPDLLLSAGKDGRVLCWNPNDTRPGGSLLCEVSSQSQWVFDVCWCPRSPALFAAASFDQRVSLHSLLGGSSRPANSTTSNNNILDSFGAASLQQLPAVSAPAPAAAAPAVPAPPRPPAWLRRPAAGKFSFGGKLVTFEKCPQEAGSQKLVYVSQVVSEPEVVEQAAELDTLLSLCRDPTATDRLAEYCRLKGEAASDQNERYTWFFLRANFLPTFRSEVLNLLGFKQDEIPSKFKGSSAVSGDYNHIDNNIDSITSGIAGLSRGESTETEAELSTDTSTDLSDAHTLIERKLSAVDAAPPVKNVSIPTGEDSTSLICRALICGNLEEAVELCLEAKRVTDALVIASLGSQELLNKVQKYHLNNTSSDPVSLIAGTLLLSRWDALIRSVATHNWRDILATIVTHCEGDALSHYCESLGDKLSSDADPSLSAPATICYLIGMSASSLLERLSSSANMQGALTELALLSQSAAAARGRQVPAGSKLDSVLNEFALRLSSQGCLHSALNILESAGQSELRDRLQNALGLLQQQRRTSGHPQQQPMGQRTRTASHTRPQYQHDNTTYNTVQPPSYNNPWSAPAAASPAPPPAQPPRPGSVGPQAGGITSRSKYKVDPSVQAAPQYGQYSFSNPAPTQPPYGYNSPIPDQYSSTTVPNNNFAPTNNNFAPTVPNNNFAPINPYNPNAFNPTPNPMGNQGQGNPVSQGNPVNGSYYGEAAPAAPSKPMQPGWNDPPMMQAKPKPKPEPVAAQAPITHPLFGTEPPQHIPLNPSLPGQQYPGNYPPGQQYPGQNYQDPGYQFGQQGYAQQGFQQQGYGQGYPPAGAPAYPQKAESPAPVAAEAAPKGPIPDEHLILQTTFDSIKQDCANHANNLAIRRKLEEVQKKLENLYDLLREYRLSESALSTLHSCAQHASAGDSATALTLATGLASGSDFATVASFLPGLKTLLQLRMQTIGR